MNGIAQPFIDTAPQQPFCSVIPGNATSEAIFSPDVWPWYQPQADWQYDVGPEFCGAGKPGPCFCYGVQPPWSAYREPSFGYGVLDFLSPHKVVWSWYKNEADFEAVADQVAILRPHSEYKA